MQPHGKIQLFIDKQGRHRSEAVQNFNKNGKQNIDRQTNGQNIYHIDAYKSKSNQKNFPCLITFLTVGRNRFAKNGHFEL